MRVASMRLEGHAFHEKRTPAGVSRQAMSMCQGMSSIARMGRKRGAEDSRLSRVTTTCNRRAGAARTIAVFNVLEVGAVHGAVFLRVEDGKKREMFISEKEVGCGDAG